MASSGSSPRLDALTNYSGWCSLSAVTGVVNFDGASLGAFSMCGGVKQGCVLPPTLLASSLPSCWNIPSMHLWRVVSSIQDQMESYSICPDWGPRPKYTKQSSGTCSLLIYVALASCPGQQLQKLVDKFSQASKDFGMTISIKKTNMLGSSIKQSMRLLTKFSVIQGGFLQQWSGASLLSTT